MAVSASGSVLSRTRYKPWGEQRGQSGAAFPTDRLFTGQIWDGAESAGGTGLYFYNARYYDPALGRFTQADTIVPEPGMPMAFDRYAYTLNNPVKYVDPSGHCAEDDQGCLDTIAAIEKEYGIIVEDVLAKEWTSDTLKVLIEALILYRGFVGAEAFTNAFFGITIRLESLGTNAGLWVSQGKILSLDPENSFTDYLDDYGGTDFLAPAKLFLKSTIVHEMTHALLDSLGAAKKQNATDTFARAAGWRAQSLLWGLIKRNINPGDGPTGYARRAKHPKEDLAESIAVLLVPGSSKYKVDTRRMNWIFAWQKDIRGGGGTGP